MMRNPLGFIEDMQAEMTDKLNDAEARADRMEAVATESLAVQKRTLQLFELFLRTQGIRIPEEEKKIEEVVQTETT